MNAGLQKNKRKNKKKMMNFKRKKSSLQNRTNANWLNENCGPRKKKGADKRRSYKT